MAMRVVTDKYNKWLDSGLERLREDFFKGDFRPENESDVRCHLYHALVKTKARTLTRNHVVLSEYHHAPISGRIDLALGKKVRDVFKPRLLIEIKETSKRHLSREDVKKKIQHDIRKLRRFKRELDARVRVKTPRIVFFFRKAEHGIGSRTDREMKKLAEDYDDVTIWWGP